MRCRWIAMVALLAAGTGCQSPPIAKVVGPSLEDYVDASFPGAESQAEERLQQVVLAELTHTEEDDVTRAKIDDAAYALELFYRDEGYPDVEVRYEFDPDGERPRARFLVAEGPRVTIRKVLVEGCQKLDDEELAGLLGEVGEGEHFVRSRLGRATGRLRTFYLGRGFLAVEVGEPVVERVAEDAARVSIAIDEGPRYRLRSVEVPGAAPELAAELDELVAASVGGPFVPHLAFQLRAGVLRAHENGSYADCSVVVDATRDEETGDVGFVLRTTPGQAVRIAGIEVRGNEGVPEKRLLARIDLGAGDAYDAERINRSFNQLYATGLFDAVRFELEGEGPERTLVANVTESPSLELFVEPGWGSYEGPRVRAGVDEGNLLSSGRRGRIEGWISELAQGLELQLTDPFLFGKALTGQATLYAQQREEPSFSFDERGAGLDVRKDWNDEFSTTVGYQFEVSDPTDDDFSSVVPQELTDSIDIGELTFTLSYDTRDNVLVPRSGGLARFHSSVALEAVGSELEAFENGLDLSHALRLGERTMLGGVVRLSFIAPYGDTDLIPLQRRLFNGGENTVRSFRESDLGPVDPKTDEPIGGEARTVLSLELRQQLKGNVSGALFYDMGNVELDYEDYFDFNGFRHGLGVGVRYLLPIGPLRLDAGWNPDHKDGESEWVVHFSVGLPY